MAVLLPTFYVTFQTLEIKMNSSLGNQFAGSELYIAACSIKSPRTKEAFFKINVRFI